MRLSYFQELVCLDRQKLFEDVERMMKIEAILGYLCWERNPGYRLDMGLDGLEARKVGDTGRPALRRRRRAGVAAPNSRPQVVEEMYAWLQEEGSYVDWKWKSRLGEGLETEAC